MLINIISGLLGVIFQILARASSIKKDFKVSNEDFVWSKFFKNEMIAIASSITSVFMLAVILNEVLTYKPDLQNYVRTLFMLTGAIGSWAFGLLLGKSKRYIRNIIDEKTNKADGIIPFDTKTD